MDVSLHILHHGHWWQEWIEQGTIHVTKCWVHMFLDSVWFWQASFLKALVQLILLVANCTYVFWFWCTYIRNGKQPLSICICQLLSMRYHWVSWACIWDASINCYTCSLRIVKRNSQWQLFSQNSLEFGNIQKNDYKY